MIQPPARDDPVGPRGEWLVGAASAYMTVLWGSLAVIWLTVGNTPTLDAIGLVIFRRRRIARLAERTRWLAALGLAVLSSLFLAGGLAFYVQFAGSPF